MPDVGVPEVLIIIAIIAILFGGSRIADLGGALGRGIREFRRALRDEDDNPPTGGYEGQTNV